MFEFFVNSNDLSVEVNGYGAIRTTIDVTINGIDTAEVDNLLLGVFDKTGELCAQSEDLVVLGNQIVGTVNLNTVQAVNAMAGCNERDTKEFVIAIQNQTDDKLRFSGFIELMWNPFLDGMDSPEDVMPLGWAKSDIENLVARMEAVKTSLEDPETGFEKQIDDFTTVKKDELNSHTTSKKGELDTHTSTKKSELDSHTNDKKGALNSHTVTKQAELDIHTSTKKGELDSHTADKKNELNSHTATKEGEITNHTNAKKGELDSHTDDKKGELNSHTDTKKAEISAINAHPPIQQGGNWWVWNENLVPPAYEDTGLKAKGEPGDPGEPGSDGLNGKSSYQLWVEDGNVGTEEDFLNSLIGPQGEQGVQGPAGQDSEYLFHPVTIENLYSTAKANPSWVLFFVTGHPDWPNGVQVIKGAGDRFFIRKNDESDLLHPISEVYLDFKNGYSVNLNNNEEHPLSNNKTSPTWLFSVEIDGDIILVDKFERLAEVQVTHPQAVSGGVQKVVQGTTALLGSVCVFDGSDDVIDFKKGGLLSDGSAIPACLPRGTKPLPETVNLYTTSSEGFGSFAPSGSGDCTVVDDPTSPTLKACYQVGTGSYQGLHLINRGMDFIPGFSNGSVIKCRFFIKNEDYTDNNKHDLYDYNGNLTLQNITISGDNYSIEKDIAGREYTLVINDNEWHQVDFEAVINDISAVVSTYLYHYERAGNSTGMGRYITGVVAGKDASAPIPTTDQPVTRIADRSQLPAEVVPSDLDTLSVVAKVTPSEYGQQYVWNIGSEFTVRIYGAESGSTYKQAVAIYDKSLSGLAGGTKIVLTAAGAVNVGESVTVGVVVTRKSVKLYINGQSVEIRDYNNRSDIRQEWGRDGSSFTDGGAVRVCHDVDIGVYERYVIKHSESSASEILELHKFIMEN